MTAPAQFPLVEVHFVANAHHEWVALSLRFERGAGAGALQAVFGSPDVLAATAPLDCVLHLDSPACLAAPVLTLLPPHRIVIVLPAALLDDAAETAQALALTEAGYRVLLDGPLPAGAERPAALRAMSFDCSQAVPAVQPAAPGPNLAHAIGTGTRLAECARAGFDWFSGDYLLHQPVPAASAQGAASRRRLLALLALLARDANARELEQLLKQDAALSFQLLKLVNSAAFAMRTPITSFVQAISLIGRRQLQRWLQLMLYARQQDDGQPNLLLSLAALRGAQLEALCRHDGGDRDAQDLAFMTGVFSLLDRLFAMPMDEVVGALSLPLHVTGALLRREGTLGERLRLVEATPPAQETLQQAGIDNAGWWNSQLHACHWAMQAGRHV